MATGRTGQADCPRARGNVRAPILVFSCLLISSGHAVAGTIEMGSESSFEYKLTTTYALAVRAHDPHGRLINDDIDPLQPKPAPPGQLVGFTNTGLSKSINLDDGNRNFTAGSVINNRISGLGQIKFRWRDYGIVASGSAFYDPVYEGSNKNNSPKTINKRGGDTDAFLKGARYYNGKRSRMLEAYAFADFFVFDDSVLTLKFGKQLVAYGESLFMPGISGAMGPFDATKAFIPGAEIKDILLPVYQGSVDYSIGLNLSMFGFYQLDWKPTEIFPVGDLFSVADLIGPGAEFAYGSINPAAGDGCPGLLGPLSPICNANGLGMPLLNAPRTIDVERLPDIRPDNDGQFGGGIRYQATSITNLGLYHIRYHSHNPTIQLNTGFAYVGSAGGQPITTEVINQPVPVTYNVRYFDDIKLYASSFTTVLAGLNIGGEVIYRDGIDVQVQSIISGVLSPIFVRGKVYSAQLSSLYVDNPRFWKFTEIAVVSEAKYIYVDKADQQPESAGVMPVGGGDQLFNDRNAWGYQMLVLLTGRNFIPGWDLKNTVAWAHTVNGNPSTTGDLGPLFGEGDRRLTLSGGMQLLQNFEFAVGYNFFFGNPRKGIRGSIVKQNPVADRDYATLSLKYNF